MGVYREPPWGCRRPLNDGVLTFHAVRVLIVAAQARPGRGAADPPGDPGAAPKFVLNAAMMDHRPDELSS
jgi:hypothetical protein